MGTAVLVRQVERIKGVESAMKRKKKKNKINGGQEKE